MAATTRPLRNGAMAAGFSLLALGAGSGALSAQDTPFAPLPDGPEINAARAALGEKLFFDSRLSGDTAIACATCHDPALGWGDGAPMSTGYTGVEYFRMETAVQNSAMEAA